MRRPFIDCKRRLTAPRSERGAYIVLFIAGFFILLALVGLAVDIGALQRHKLRLQRAVDAASVSATWMLQTLSPNDVRDTAQKMVEDNLREMDLTLNPATVINVAVVDQNGAPSPPGPARQVRVSASLDVPLYIMPLIPFINRNVDVVSATAVAGDRRLVVSLIIDVSGSMCGNQYPSCCDGPANNPSCCHADPPCTFGGVPVPTYPAGCFDPVTGAGTCAKLEKAKEAATGFVNIFGNEDRLGIVKFSDNGNAVANMAKVTPAHRTNLLNAISQLFSGGYTNTEDALRVAIDQVRSQTDLSPNDFKAVVLLTDGVPTRGQTPAPTGCDWGTPSTEKGRYLKAIERSDLARNSNGITVFTIGLGNVPVEWGTAPPAGYGYNPRDPWMGAITGGNAEQIVKSTFLARVANDWDYLDVLPTASPTVPAEAFPDFPCSTPNATIAPVKPGKFYLTPNPAQLPGILASIGQSIKALLSE